MKATSSAQSQLPHHPRSPSSPISTNPAPFKRPRPIHPTGTPLHTRHVSSPPPPPPFPSLFHAKFLVSQGKFEDALLVLKNDSEVPHLLLVLKCLFSLERYAELENRANQTLSAPLLSPALSCEVNIYLSVSLLKQNKTDQAIQCLRTLLHSMINSHSKDPHKLIRTNFLLGQAYLIKSLFKKASQHFSDAMIYSSASPMLKPQFAFFYAKSQFFETQFEASCVTLKSIIQFYIKKEIYNNVPTLLNSIKLFKIATTNYCTNVPGLALSFLKRIPTELLDSIPSSSDSSPLQDLRAHILSLIHANSVA